MAHAGLAGPGPQNHPPVWALWLSPAPGEPGEEEYQADAPAQVKCPPLVLSASRTCLVSCGFCWCPVVDVLSQFPCQSHMARPSTCAIRGQQPITRCCQKPGEAATSPWASSGAQQPSRNAAMVPANPHLQHHHSMTSVTPKTHPCSPPTPDRGLEHLSADECQHIPPCSSCLKIKVRPGNQHHFCEQCSFSRGAEAVQLKDEVSMPCLDLWHGPLAFLHSLHTTSNTVREHVSKLNPGDWFCWKAPFNPDTGWFGVCGLGCYRTAIPRIPGSPMGTCCHPLQDLP